MSIGELVYDETAPEITFDKVYNVMKITKSKKATGQTTQQLKWLK